MKSQKHNSGDLKELKVNIEKEVVESIERMSEVSGMSVDEIVVIALKGSDRATLITKERHQISISDRLKHGYILPECLTFRHSISSLSDRVRPIFHL